MKQQNTDKQWALTDKNVILMTFCAVTFNSIGL